MTVIMIVVSKPRTASDIVRRLTPLLAHFTARNGTIAREW